MSIGKSSFHFNFSLFFKLAIILLIVFSYSIPAQQFGTSLRVHHSTPAQKITKTLADPLPEGTYTVGITGDFPTIDSAFNRLSSDGILGPVTLELIDELYTAPSTENGFLLSGPIPGANGNNCVLLRPADDKNVIITGSGQSVLKFINTSYITLDGIALNGPTSLTITAQHNSQFPYNDGLDFLDNSNHNITRYITVQSEDYERSSCGIAFFTNDTETPDSNLIENNFIKSGNAAIYMGAPYNSIQRPKDNIIRGNYVGSETDSLIEYGILLQFCSNSLIENNIVQNLKVNAITSDGSLGGIYAVLDDNDIIRNNIVHNIKAESGFTSLGIALSGDGSMYGHNNLLYNNMVYDIQGASVGSYHICSGFFIYSQVDPKIYYNSVTLSGNNQSNNAYGSAALGIYGASTSIKAKNNILVNIRDESPSCATTIFNYTSTNLSSENNDLYYIQNQYNCLVKIAGTDYLTLAEWQATGHDINSISEMPNFIGSDLHINEIGSTRLESHGIPITGIETDLDGDLRNNSTPDIGADEFNGAMPVEEWYQIAGPFEGMTRGRISVVDPNIIWIAGGYPAGPPRVYRTIDGGLNWTEIPTDGLPYYLMAIAGKDALTAFIGDAGSINGGGNAKFYKTTDAGQHWIVIDSTGGTGGFFNDIQFSKSNPEFGIAMSDPPNGTGNDYIIEKTTNGGMTWERTTVPGQLNCYGLYYIAYPIDDQFYGFATFNVTNNIMKSYTTSDGGANWYLGDQGISFANWGGGDIVFNDDKQHGIMFGADIPNIMVTSDGGHVWTEVNTNTDISGFSTASWVSGTDVVFICSIYSTSRNKIIRSDDNGLTWQSQVTPDLSVIELDNVNINGGVISYAITSEGMILKCTQPVILPVELSSFTASKSVEGVKLNWVTATETNNRGFEIERSYSSEGFITIGYVKGQGTTTEQHNYTYTDNNLNQGSYSYRLKQYDFDGTFHYSDVVKVDFNIPLKFALEQNYPNPFNPATTIKWQSPEDGVQTLKIYDVLGNEVKMLVNEFRQAGRYEISFDARSLASGIYFYRFTAGKFSSVRKMILLK